MPEVSGKGLTVNLTACGTRLADPGVTGPNRGRRFL